MTGLGVTFVAINTDEYFKARIITNIESSTADLSVSDKKYIIMRLLTTSFSLN